MRIFTGLKMRRVCVMSSLVWRFHLIITSSDEGALSNAISRVINEKGSIDGLILNAGTLDPLGRIDSPENNLDSWKAHFDVNFFSLISAVKASLPELRKSSHGGRVVFVSSGAAVGGTEGWG